MTASSRKVFSPRLLACLVVTLMVFTLAASMPAFAQCPAINAIGEFKTNDIGLNASFTISTVTNPNDTATYDVTTPNESPTDGVPGLIAYCIYPSQPPGNPDSAVALFDSWKTKFATIQGYFVFVRPDGNPTNIPFDGTTQTVGQATWAAGAPTVQTILLHINDAAECDELYGGNPGTCFVFPGGGGTPPPPVCNGDPACKSVVIDEADQSDPFTVPGNTLLHIHYTYVIINQPSNLFDMIFKFPWAKTDINNGGGKDYFGCEQLPDPAGYPGFWDIFHFTDSNSNPWNLNFAQGSGTCNQSRFFLRPDGQWITLTPGQSVTFNVDMITRKNKGKNQEYTSCGLHLLNSGFTVKWFQSDTGNLLHNFSTNITPIFVNVVSGGKLVCP